ncbi:MAG: hypothetical protein JO019_04810 [Candidatus Kaiserbacteria bacterium]|nr:hypothetical protein [Candidatus Kaiserbacteria bacterium]
MRIDFFEETPTPNNLAKTASLGFPSTIYLASRSLNEFQALSASVRGATPAYWAIFSRSYWISPFSFTDELERLLIELQSYAGAPLQVLIDLELPILTPRLFLRNLFRFHKNKQLTARILALHGTRGLTIATAEYPAIGVFSESIKRALGIAYAGSHARIPRYYTSMIRSYTGSLQDFVLRKMRDRIRARNEAGEAISVGLGATAEGHIGHEQILTAAELENDLTDLQKIGVGAVTIFRLGGMTEEHLDVVARFAHA